MITSTSNREWAPFNQDVSTNEGYLYTTNPPLSSRIASRRHSDAILAAADFRGKRVIDVGCGDGTLTVELFDSGMPASVYAFDPAPNAIEVARKKAGARHITFEVASAYEVPCEDKSFDIAQLRGVLHHMDRPVDALRESLRVASTIVVLEPNGYNLGLKMIEKLSKYHREHDEKSYPAHQLERWIRELGGRVEFRDWVCFVPYFCPDWFARATKALEPLVECVPLVDRIGCGALVMVATRGNGTPRGAYDADDHAGRAHLPHLPLPQGIASVRRREHQRRRAR
jgi:ubiquinone/menaquinone biosynthesis C-methylase UbiE